MKNIPTFEVNVESVGQRGILKVVESAAKKIGDFFLIEFKQTGRTVDAKLILAGKRHFDLWKSNPSYFVKDLRKLPSTAAVGAAILGNTLVTSSGSKWRQFRRKTTPLVRPSIAELKHSLSQATQDLCCELAVDDDFSIQEVATRWAIRSLTEPVLCGVVPFEKLNWTIDEFKSLSIKLAREFPLTKRRSLEDAYEVQILREYIDYLTDVAISNIKNGSCKLIPRELIERGEREYTTQELVRSIVVGTFLIGADNLACALVWSCIHLASSEDLGGKMCDRKYSQMCVLESLRLTPPQPLFERQIGTKMQIDGTDIPSGTDILFVPWIAHRSPNYWESPRKFRPNRFDSVSNTPMNEMAFFPFGIGKRRCIGADITIEFTSFALSRMLEIYRLAIADKTRPASILPTFHLNLVPRGQVFLSSQRR